jgi:protein involved in polysaccharide export with SLBB domain
VASGFAWMLAQAPVSCAQSDVVTQQDANDKLSQLARSVHTPVHDYAIGRGDAVSVEVFDVPELSRTLRVSQTGTIGIPLVPVRLYVVGLTEIQLQQKIAEVLEAQGLVSHPQVSVFVTEKRSKPIAVVGAIARPGVIQADRPITLIEALAESGGIAGDAGDTVLITRGVFARTDAQGPPEIGLPEGSDDKAPAGNPSPAPANPQQLAPEMPLTPVQGSGGPPGGSGDRSAAPSAAGDGTQKTATPSSASAAPPPVSNPEPPPNTISVNLFEILEKGDTRNNVALEAGDVVTVPHAGVIYAMGAVGRPGGYVASGDRSQLTTLKLLALAGGTTRTARRGRAVIIRRDAQGHQQAIPVDLAKIVKRENEDVRLLASDILYVPDNYTKASLIRISELAISLGTALVFYHIAYN